MEKAIQAVNIAATTTTNNGNTVAKAGENAETTPFSQLLSPAREQAMLPADQQSGDSGGNPLPGVQALPEGTVAQPTDTETEVLSSLLEQADAEVAMPSAEVTISESGVLSNEADGETDVTATVTTPTVTTATVPEAPVEVPVVNTDSSKVVAEQKPAVAPGANVRVEQPVADVASSVLREAAGTVNRGESVTVLPAQATQVTTGSSTTSSSTTLTAAVETALRGNVQQAVAAQVAQDGLQQSLSGNRQATRAPLAEVRASIEHISTGFTPLLNDAASVASSARVSVPVGEAGWGRAVGEQVVWHVSQNIQSANLRLNPQHLGPLEMQVQMEGDKATLAFTSQHAQVRDALESALPRLREMFAQNGLNIVDVNVSQQQAGKGEQQSARSTVGERSAEHTTLVEDTTDTVANSNAEGVGIVDYYI